MLYKIQKMQGESEKREEKNSLAIGSENSKKKIWYLVSFLRDLIEKLSHALISTAEIKPTLYANLESRNSIRISLQTSKQLLFCRWIDLKVNLNFKASNCRIRLERCINPRNGGIYKGKNLIKSISENSTVREFEIHRKRERSFRLQLWRPNRGLLS